MSSIASRDDNRVTTLMGINNVTGLPQEVLVDSNGRILVSAIVSGVGITGPVTSTVGALALWGDATGDSLTDSTVKLVTGVFSPVTSDAVALGSGTLMWSDLFLASGSVINWNNGDITLTHSANALDIDGGVVDFGSTPTVNGAGIYFSGGTDVAVADGGTGASDASGARTNLGLVIGTNVQAFDATLTSLAALGTVADRIAYTTGIDTWAETAITAFGRSLIDDSDNTTARTTLGLGSIATQASSSVSITGGSITGITDLALADGGTGASLVDPNADRILFWDDSAGAVTWLTVGTGLSITDTTISASATSTPRRNLNVQLNTTSAQLSGDTSPTDSTATNGVSCSTNVSGGNSALKVNLQTAATWDFYDKDPEFNFSMNYSAGSATGTGIVWFGDTADQLPPTRTQVNKGIFVAAVTTAGTTAWYAVNADGTTNTNTELAGITSAQQNQWRVVMDSGTNIKYYCNYTLVATHTTNLPSGDFAATSWLEMGVDNGAADSTTRTCTFGYVDVLMDSPTG